MVDVAAGRRSSGGGTGGGDWWAKALLRVNPLTWTAVLDLNDDSVRDRALNAEGCAPGADVEYVEWRARREQCHAVRYISGCEGSHVYSPNG